MILKITHQDSDNNNTNNYFDLLRQKNHEASFGDVKNFIEQREQTIRHRRRQRKPLRQWQWMLAVLLPLLVVLACTKTEHSEPIGQTVSFSVPDADGVVKQQLKSIISEVQKVVTPNKQKAGYLSYVCFIDQNSGSADVIISKLKAVKGITNLSTLPLNAQVRESLLSRIGYKIFSTHIDAMAMLDDEQQNILLKQLKDNGFDDISLVIIGNENGVRTLELYPTEDANKKFKGGVSIDKGTKVVVQDERMLPEQIVDFSKMNDAQVRDYVRSQKGKQLTDRDIKIVRSPDAIEISIKMSDKKEEVIYFPLR